MRVENLTFAQALDKLQKDDGRIGNADFPIAYFFVDDDSKLIKSSINSQSVSLYDLLKTNWFWEDFDKDVKIPESKIRESFDKLISSPDFSESEKRKIEKVRDGVIKDLGFKKK